MNASSVVPLKNFGFWFLVCNAATQLATQSPQRRIQLRVSRPSSCQFVNGLLYGYAVSLRSY